MTEVNQARVSEVVEYLQGTCNSLDDVLTDEERDSIPFLQEIDAQIFLCDECGWWCKISEMHEGKDMVCEDCGGES